MTTTRFEALIDDDNKVQVAIYTGTDSDPLTDPLGNLSRVRFHNRLRYPAIVAEYSGTLSLPSRSANTIGWTAHNLFAHGRTGTPLVIGYAVVSGNRRRIAGSWPVQGNEYGWGRWLSIGANGTYVRMAESWFAGGQGGGGYSSKSVDWVAYVLDATFDDTPAPSEKLDATHNHFVAGDFDSDKRYLRAGNTLSNFPIVRGGKTIAISIATPSNYPTVALTYSLAGDTLRTNYTAQPAPGVFVPVQGPSFAPDSELVTT